MSKTEMKPLVIYHADCTDGFCAAFAAYLKLGDGAEYLPMQYGEIKSIEGLQHTLGRHPADSEVYILDFGFERGIMNWLFANAKRVVWLDHHKTAFEMWCGDMDSVVVKDGRYEERGYAPTYDDYIVILDSNKSGALLAWEYFHPGIEVPMLFRHIDDRDRWQFKLEGSRELHAMLASYKPWSFEQWESVFFGKVVSHSSAVQMLTQSGAAILRAQDRHVASMAKQARGCKIEFNEKTVHSEDQPNCPIRFYEFRTGLAVNATLHISEVGYELANQSGTFGLVWCLASDNKVKCSLRSNGDYDVSAIAKALGGGGHRNAAGFETDIETLMGWLK